MHRTASLLPIGVHEKIHKLEWKTESTLTGQHQKDMVCFASLEPRNPTWNCAHKQRGNRVFGLLRARQFPWLLKQWPKAWVIASNEVTNPVLSATSDSSIYVTRIVNHEVTCILLDTCTTVSVLNKETWRKSGFLPKLKLAIGTLNTKNRNELTVLDQTEVRFCLESTDWALPVMIEPVPIPWLHTWLRLFSAL